MICNSANYDLQPNKFAGKELLSMHGLNQYDSKARMQEFQLPGFTTPDSLCENYYDWSPYGYCMGNPIRNIDPDGEAVETVWDVYSLVTGVKSFVDNVKAGNVVGAVVDGVGIVVDAVAVAVPGVPGGAGAAIKGIQALDKGVDVVKTVDKAVETGKYSSIPDPRNAGSGKKTTPVQRKKILEANRERHNGELRSDGDGRKLNNPSKNVKGQKADMDQAEVEHVKARSQGGSNENNNMQVLSKEENLKKGNR